MPLGVIKVVAVEYTLLFRCHCLLTEQESTAVSEELLEAQIVAQAITELQEIQAPSTQVCGMMGSEMFI